MRRAFLKSPKATQIKKVFAEPNSEVSSGDILLELFDFEERKISATIRRAAEENRAKLSEVTGERVKTKIAHLETILDQRTKALADTQRNYGELEIAEHFGSVPDWKVFRARHFIAMRTYQTLQASVELELYKRNISDSANVLTIVDRLLSQELDYVETLRSRLSVKAPLSGKFRCYVIAGDTVPLGHILGEIG